jgi:glucan biosynthesis protein C
LPPPASPSRHYGLDWLRIGAFALLICYHVVMVYGPEHWVIHSHYRYDWLRYPLEAVGPWRLMLLFMVSGYATAAMLAKAGRPIAFLRTRSRRLLLPLAFGVIAIVPVQGWVRQVVDHGYHDGLAHFWAFDYFRFGPLAGETLPHWEHLWFLGYLWFYTAMLIIWLGVGGSIRLPRRYASPLTLLLLPIVTLVTGRIAIGLVIHRSHGLFDDWVGHLHYAPAFLFGYLLARDPQLWGVIRRGRWVALAMAVGGYALALLATPGHAVDTVVHRASVILFDLGDSGFAWAMMLFLTAAADAWVNRDHRWRLPLSRAVFPAYIIHQSAIVWLVFALRDRGLSIGNEAALVLGGTVAACIATWWVAKRWGPAGMLLGYDVAPPRRAQPASLATTTA